MNKDLIDKLLAQHAALIAVIVDVKKMSAETNPPYAKIAVKLNDLGKLLVEHIHLENNRIYRNLFESPKKDSASAYSTKSFVEEMKFIRKGTVAFLNTYNDARKISDEFEDFKIQLGEVEKILITRIRLEEDGLFKLFEKII